MDHATGHDGPGDLLAEVERHGVRAFEALMARRKELGTLACATLAGRLDQPVSETEEALIRDSLALAYFMASANDLRAVLLGTATEEKT